MPFRSLLILLITVATGSSTVAAFLVAIIVGNPLTYIPFYYLAWLVGDFLLPGRANWETLKMMIERMQEAGFTGTLSLAGQVGLDTALVLLAGGLILALPPAVCSYPFALRFFLQLEGKRRRMHLLNNKSSNLAP